MMMVRLAASSIEVSVFKGPKLEHLLSINHFKNSCHFNYFNFQMPLSLIKFALPFSDQRPLGLRHPPP
jgi:hypothetical protein